MTEPIALGLDVGLAKVKLCAAALTVERPRWVSDGLPYTDRLAYQRHADFEEGIPTSIRRFLRNESSVGVAVVSMSSGYGYPSYREGVVHTMSVIALAMPGVPCFALSGSGELVSADDVRDGAADIVGPLVFSNGMGAAHLARRMPCMGSPAHGLALDTGGSTTAITPIVAGDLDPASLASPRDHLDHRLRHGKLVWIGAQTTPLEALAEEVDLRGRRYPVIPRGVTFDHVSVLLDLLPADRARKLSLFGALPSRHTALRGVADAINLDPDMAKEPELLEVARFFHRRAVERLARGVRAACGTMPPSSPRKAVLFGLGASGLALPALLEAGFDPADVVLASDVIPKELAEVASCYGACHRGLEYLSGQSLPASLEVGVRQ